MKYGRRSLPGTPIDFAAPELLLRFASEVTMAIDIWALGCVMFQLFAQDNPFIGTFATLPEYIAANRSSVGYEHRSGEVSKCNLQNGGGKNHGGRD